MDFDEREIEGFREDYQAGYGEELTPDEARAMYVRLRELYRTLYRRHPDETRSDSDAADA